jgi:hypothetical protein
MAIYCGNNNLHQPLINGEVELGTRYTCLKKGIGTGLNLPYDNNYSLDYEPIDNTRIYCGNNDVLPRNYDRFGNLPQCLQKGVALGKRQKALNYVFVQEFVKSKIFFIIYVLILIIYTIIIVTTKPSFLIKNVSNTDNNERKFDSLKLFLFMFFSGCVLLLILFVVFHLLKFKVF